MYYKDLTPYQRKKFRQNCYCSKCGSLIYNEDEFEMILRTHGRFKIYSFNHIRGCKNGEGSQSDITCQKASKS